jgi:hypothetical protein
LSQLIDTYQNETGGKQSVPPILSDGYSGPLKNDSFEEHVSEQVRYGDAFISDVDMADAEGFFDWLGSKAETETQKMVKMMQTYNVDNKRRDPILLSNKSGSQRR